MTITDALLKRVSEGTDSFAPNDLGWAAWMEVLLSDQPMPTSEQLDVLAGEYKRIRAERMKEPTHD